MGVGAREGRHKVTVIWRGGQYDERPSIVWIEDRFEIAVPGTLPAQKPSQQGAAMLRPYGSGAPIAAPLLARG